ncbi:beta strand repeat-containing protein, partial [Endobacterium cereale]|uniref:beta strand repeat-containing protein n=1 Tax=Endobacterium cereale TaxID=2663029 RepID=UPI002C452074|nr:hypothetical protein [Endobacterium cereale]
TVPTPASGLTLSVTAAITDIAGNTATPTTVTAVVDTIVPGLPGVSLGNGDGLLNTVEVAGGTVNVSVSLAGTGAAAGDTLTVNGTAIVLTAAQITAGVATTTVPAPANGLTLTVTASLTDPAGNTSPVATATAVVDTTAPGLPTVTLGDGVGPLNASEVAGGTVNVSVRLTGTGAVAGDTLTVNGTPIVLTAAQITAGIATTTVPAPADGATLTVTTTLTDAAGNTSPPATVNALVDATAPGVPTVTVGDGIGPIGPGEITGNTVPVTVNLAGTGALAGDTLIVNGTPTILTAAQVAAGTATVTVPLPAGGAPLDVTVTLTDVAGNISTPITVTVPVDTTAPTAPGVTIGDGNNTIVVGELVGGAVPISVSITGTGAVAGDTLTINGTAIVLTAAQITAGVVTTTLPTPADGQTLIVTATLTDLAGNISAPTTVSAVVDTDLLGAPTITLGDGDGFINAAEATGNTVPVSISLAGTGAVAGDTLTINGATSTLTQAQIDAGVVVTTVPAPLNGATLTVTASLTDSANISSPVVTATAVADFIAPTAPAISIGDGNAYIVAGEITNGQVTVSLSLVGTGAVAGDTLTVNGTDIVLTQAQITAGVVTTALSAPVNGQALSVTASLADIAGNSSPIANASAIVDISAPGLPVVTLGNGDGVLGPSEVVGNTVPVSVSLAGTNAVAGDTLTVNGTVITLTQAQITAGVATTTVPALGNGATLTVTASLTDAAGNASPTATTTAVVDLTAPGQVTVTLGNGDGFINAAEGAGGTVPVSVSLAGTGAAAGDTLTVNGTAIVLTAAQIAAGVVATTVPTPASGLTLSVTAAITDIAGNTATPTTVTAV